MRAIHVGSLSYFLFISDRFPPFAGVPLIAAVPRRITRRGVDPCAPIPIGGHKCETNSVFAITPEDTTSREAPSPRMQSCILPAALHRSSGCSLHSTDAPPLQREFGHYRGTSFWSRSPLGFRVARGRGLNAAKGNWRFLVRRNGTEIHCGRKSLFRRKEERARIEGIQWWKVYRIWNAIVC